MADPESRRSLVVPVVAGSLLAYSMVTFVLGSRWISGLLAAVVAWLLWRRHPRARFAAYVFLSAIGLRGLIAGHWEVLLFAVALLGVLQMPAAWRVWPRLTWGWSRRGRTGRDRRDGDRMARP